MANRIIFDTETTGLNSQRDEILEIAFIDADGNTLHVGRYKPSRATSWPEAAAVNGIWPEDVADCPPINHDVDLIKRIIENSDEIVGYNVEFDLGFLAALGIEPRADAKIIRYDARLRSRPRRLERLLRGFHLVQTDHRSS